MAKMIPDACPSKATIGEKRTFSLFQRLLPDNFLVWYEPVLRSRYPDFTILADTFGLLVVEVKGWYPKNIVRVDGYDVELLFSEDGVEDVRRAQNPLRQARDYMFAAMHRLQAEPLLRVGPNGDRPGKLCFPCAYAVLFTNITRDQLDQAGLSAAFPPDKVICRDELLDLEARADDQRTLRRLRRLFEFDFPFEPLTHDQVRTVRGVLHQEVVVRERPATPASVPPRAELLPDARVFDVLDAKQEQAARSLGDGHRIIFGAAGSGKTVPLLARAKLLARQDAGKRVLALCYNRTLSTYIASQFRQNKELAGVEGTTFHSWAMRATRLKPGPDGFGEAFDETLTEKMLERTSRWPEAKKYDAIVIDEAHDFRPDWFRCCVNALKGGPEGDLLIAVDGAQSVYGRPRSFQWKDVGVVASGRSRQFSKNYRNTKEILEFAWSIAQAGLEDGEATETHQRVRPTVVVRSGEKPKYLACDSLLEERAAVVKLVEHYRRRGVPERDIAVLYAREQRGRVRVLCEALRKSGEVFWVSDPSDHTARDHFLTRPGVRLCTIKSAKGLEFPVVILAALDQLPMPDGDGVAADANLFYVGMTRAIGELVLTWAGRSDFTERVRRSSKAVPFNF